MTATKKNITIAILAFAFMCVALASCDRHTCPTYSKTTETSVENRG
ncbi:MAG: hypothetical protein JSS76_01920 [Bacteroidetes bacterium]|nr:hypothetical protein [Bacteroidota bacterium]MBS1623746.1 hypothetical protein [Bacteroidota bacterium]MBS1683480.1 hypothetical protein [Bacteroidota bacterium]